LRTNRLAEKSIYLSKKPGPKPVPTYWVEPVRLRPDFCEVKKKQYKRGLPRGSTGYGIEFHTTRTLNSCKVLQGTYNVLTDMQILSIDMTVNDYRDVLHRYNRLRRFFLSEVDIFGTSRVVRQYLKVISITLRLTKRHLRCRDSHSMADRDTRKSIGCISSDI